MAADYSKPTTGSNYTTFPTEIRDNVDASLTQLRGFTNAQGTARNVPTNAIQWDDTNKRWNYWDGDSFEPLLSTTETLNLSCNINATGLKLGDKTNTSNKVTLGTNGDAWIGHSGSNFQIHNDTGNSYFDAAANVILRAGGTTKGLECIGSGTTTLFHNGNSRFSTGDTNNVSNAPLDVNGTLTCDHILSIDATSAASSIEVGKGRSGNNSSYVDLISAASEGDYNARLIKASGADGELQLTNKGTGTFYLVQQQAGALELKTSNSTAMHIDSDQNVSIGTTINLGLFDVASASTPEVYIHSTANSSNDCKLHLRGSRTNSTTTDLVQILFETNDNANTGVYAQGSAIAKISAGKGQANTNKGQLYFSTVRTSGSTPSIAMTIDDEGQCGIGTTTPTELLHLESSASGGNHVLLKNTGDNIIQLKGDSNVSSSGSLFQVKGLWNGTDVGVIKFLAGSDTTNKDDGSISFSTRASGAALAEVMRLTEGGLCGINKNSPEGVLHAHSAAGDANFFLTTGTTTGNTQVVFGDSSDSDIGKIQYAHSENSMSFHTNTNEHMRLSSGGHFYFNTTTNYPGYGNTNGGLFMEKTANGAALFISKSNNVNLFLNRNDYGALIALYKEGVSVGSINTIANGIKIPNIAIGATSVESTVSINTNQRIQTASYVIAGLGGAGVALTVNDGGGNANVCFNHVSQTPEQNGKAGRIDVNTDNTGDTAIMAFSLDESAVADTQAATTDIMRINRGPESTLSGGSSSTLRNQVQVSTGTTTHPSLTWIGDSDTGFSRSAANTISVITQRVERISINNSRVLIAGELRNPQTAKAWVNFNGGGTVTKRDDYNVSSVSDNGTGNYVVNWDTDFSDVNYAAVVTVSSSSFIGGTGHGTAYIQSQAASSMNIKVFESTDSADVMDKDIVNVVAFSN
tara:strand:- start:265 stop:3018 length:2754 start_codon:yes stop_codon:yes gene_type:complete